MTATDIAIREARLEDLDAIANIYSTLWCNTLRNRGDLDDARLAARFNVAMQLQSSPVALVAEESGAIIACCCIGIYSNGDPQGNAAWQACYDELLAQATERARTADAKLEGSLFGDSREKATARRFAKTGNEYAQGQINLIMIHPDQQGRSLGRAFIDRARKELGARGCTKFFLMTDNQSDYAFYDHIGMTRIAEDRSQDTGDGFIVYLYGDTTDKDALRYENMPVK